MIHSMTAYARATHDTAAGRLTVEMRSVNHRYLDVNVRSPELLRSCESGIREHLRKKLDRGKVDVNLRLDAALAPDTSTSQLEVDAVRLDAVTDAARSVRNALGDDAGPINPLDVLRWPGVVREPEVDEEALASDAMALIENTIDEFIEHRSREGGRLAILVEERLTGIEEIVAEVQQVADDLVVALRSRLTERTAELLQPPLDATRLEQEVALLAQKADVAEELDRLTAHVAEIRQTLSKPGPSGRRLDFLAQELNREANTLASKASRGDVALRAVDLKVLIEQIREQIQNVE